MQHFIGELCGMWVLAIILSTMDLACCFIFHLSLFGDPTNGEVHCPFFSLASFATCSCSFLRLTVFIFRCYTDVSCSGSDYRHYCLLFTIPRARCPLSCHHLQPCRLRALLQEQQCGAASHQGCWMPHAPLGAQMHSYAMSASRADPGDVP